MNNKIGLEYLRNFQTAFNSPYNTKPTTLSTDGVKLRKELFDEEVKEFIDAFNNNDHVEILDAIGDMLFLIYGDIASFGLQEYFNYVIPSDMEITKDNCSNYVESLLSSKICDEYPNFGIDINNTLNTIKFRLWVVYNLGKVFYGTEFDDIINEALKIVYDSNMSKLGSDGKPIINGQGIFDAKKPLNKVLKSENFYEPTEKLIELLKKYNKNH